LVREDDLKHHVVEAILDVFALLKVGKVQKSDKSHQCAREINGSVMV
jgi:hypothetical protein